jgi:hypothetical protein
MGDVRLPLSGNVWQDFNPFRWFFDSVGQMSFFTVNVGRSSDPQVEQAILEVASYGRSAWTHRRGAVGHCRAHRRFRLHGRPEERG